MIKNKKFEIFLFDIGGVLLNWSLEQTFSRFFDIKKEHSAWNALSKLWEKLDRGTLKEWQVDSFLNQFGLSPKSKQLICNIRGQFLDDIILNLEVIKIFKNLLERGKQVYILSNISYSNYEKIQKKFRLFDAIAGKLLSAQCGILKPEKAIFSKLISLFKIEPEVALFIDDQKENIKSAQLFGFNTFLYRNDNSNLKALIYSD